MDGQIVHVPGQDSVLQAAHLLHLAQLTVDIPGVFDGDLRLPRHGGVQGGAVRVKGGQGGIAQPGAADEVGQPGPVLYLCLPAALQQGIQSGGRGHAGVLQPAHLPVGGLIFGQRLFILLLGHQTQLIADGGQAAVGVILAVEQAVLRAGGHHAVGLVGALGHQVVHQHADVALIPAQDHGGAAQQL